MKKIAYQAPAMEIIKLNVQGTVLNAVSATGDKPGYGGEISGEGPDE